jgi:phosphosulfolactate synthase
MDMGMEGRARRGRFDEYLSQLGVAELAPSVYPFDPGIAPSVMRSHLEQSGHLMLGVKISMACWMIADEAATRSKVQAAHEAGVPANTGGGPYEVAIAQGRLDAYLDLCADVGFDSIECGAGFTDPGVGPTDVIRMVSERGLGVDYEIGKKHGGELDAAGLEEAIEEGRRWLEAGARRLIVEARESAAGVGLFDAAGNLNAAGAERIAHTFGLESVIFEAPTKSSQFALLDHFGPRVQLSNVRLDEVLRVEIYRRGLHSDAFSNPKLRPQAVSAEARR